MRHNYVCPVYKYQARNKLKETEKEGERYRGTGRRIGDNWKKDLEKKRERKYKKIIQIDRLRDKGKRRQKN